MNKDPGEIIIGFDFKNKESLELPATNNYNSNYATGWYAWEEIGFSNPPNIVIDTGPPIKRKKDE